MNKFVRTHYVASLIFIYLLAAGLFTHLYLEQHGESIGGTIDSSVNFTIERPFVLRVLTPLLIKQVYDALPDKIINKIQFHKGQPRKLNAVNSYRWEHKDLALFVVYYFLLWVTMIATLFCWRHLLIMHGNFSRAICDVMPILASLALPNIYVSGASMYDAGEILCFSVMLIFFLKQQWLSFFIVMAISCFNKETAIIAATWPFVVGWLTGERRKGVILSAIGVAVSLPVILGVRWYFSDHPGAPQVYHFMTNVSYLFEGKPFVRLDDHYAPGIKLPSGVNFVVLFVFLTPVILCWRTIRETKILNTTLIVAVSTVLAIFPLFMVFGHQDEVRVFGPAIPSLMVVVTQCLIHYYRHVLLEGGVAEIQCDESNYPVKQGMDGEVGR